MNPMTSGDTIAAISSAVGRSARMIVRASGPGSGALAERLCGDRGGAGARRAALKLAGLGAPIWIWRFVAPASYTGEDMVELHLPGNPLLARLVLGRMLELGARGAEAGEFTARAWFNGKMDLVAAEAVAATIRAHGQQELMAARQLAGGELARRLGPMMEELAGMLALVEAGIDFSDEDVEGLSAGGVRARARRLEEELAGLVAGSARFEMLSHEPRFVLAGRPGAGKSTLLNALAGRQRAVVSAAPGTTRDVLAVELALDRGMVWLMDGAGLEQEPGGEGQGSTELTIARRMREQTLRALAGADHVMLVVDATDDRPALQLPREPELVVRTKLDLADAGREGLELGGLAGEAVVGVSAVDGRGMERLRRRMSTLAFGGDGPGAGAGPGLALNARHLQALAEARSALERVRWAGDAAEILALELREALDALGGIVGRVTPDDILGRVFAGFCIGK
jgi:tRNA modification GTPase